MNFGKAIVSPAALLEAAPCSLPLSPATANTMLDENHLLQVKIKFKNNLKYFLKNINIYVRDPGIASGETI